MRKSGFRLSLSWTTSEISPSKVWLRNRKKNWLTRVTNIFDEGAHGPPKLYTVKFRRGLVLYTLVYGTSTWKSKMAAAAILNFRIMSTTPDWIKPHNQKWEPEVNSRDVIKWTSNVWSISASISVTVIDIWTKFGIELKHQTINTPQCTKFT